METSASNQRVRRAVRAILGGVSAISLSAMAVPSLAADSAGPLEEVTVTGLRASLQKSLDIKRDSLGVVDAISAEDIGKFPDSNLATAMERIPGVTVSRGSVNLGGVSASTGSSAQITVRGFGPQFNQTLFDGRTVPSAIGNRGFDFGAVGSDFVGQVDVMKTPDATLSSGAIGATINIKYPKPFDRPGMQLTGSISGNESSGENKLAPSASILFSNTFADDHFGILVDAAYSDSKTRGNHVDIQGWEGSQLAPSQLAGAAAGASTTPSITNWFIQDYGIYQEHTEDKRIDGRLVLQAHPMDGLTFTLDDNYSKEKLVQQQDGFSVWFNNGSLTNVTQAADGTVTSFVQPNSPTDFQAAINGEVHETNTTGLNVKWEFDDHNSYVFDAYSATSKLNPGGELSEIDADVGYGNSPANNTNVGVVVGSGSSLPYPINYGPSGVAANFLNKSIIGSHVLVMDTAQNTNTLRQFKLEGEWHDEQLKFKYGVQLTRNEEELSGFTDLPYTWQTYAGYGPAPQGSGGVAPIPANLISGSFTTGSGFINGYSNGDKLPAAILAANGNAILNYLQGLNGVGQNVGACSNLSGATPCTGKYIMYPNVGQTQDIKENTVAPYINLSTTLRLAERDLKVNIGARYEVTNVSSGGLSRLPTGQLTVLPQDITAYNVNYTPQSNVVTKSSDRNLLPNIDLVYSLTDAVQLRFDASRTLTRAPLTLLTPDLNVPAGQRVGALNATGGNPTLKPYQSDNLDLGAAWFYARNSYVAADVFVKNVTNFIVGGTIQQGINGVTLPNGSPAIFSVTSQVNGPSAEVKGVELTVQHLFGDTGFGIQANATVVDTDKPYDPKSLTLSGFAVTGLANSFNIVPFYDKNGFQARVALNHRDEYLDHFGQHQPNSAYGAEPVFVKDATYVDFSTSYQLTKNFNVFFEALNLTNEVYATRGRFSEQLLDVVDTGRTFTLGVRAKL